MSHYTGIDLQIRKGGTPETKRTLARVLFVAAVCTWNAVGIPCECTWNWAWGWSPADSPLDPTLHITTLFWCCLAVSLSLSSHIFSYLPCIIIAYRADLGPCQPLIEAHQLFSEVQQSCGQSFSLQLLPLTQLGRLIVNYLRMPSSALGSASVELLLFWTLLVFGLNLQIKQTHHTAPHSHSTICLLFQKAIA